MYLISLQIARECNFCRDDAFIQRWILSFEIYCRSTPNGRSFISTGLVTVVIILFQSLESVLGRHLRYITQRRQAYFNKDEGQEVGETWCAVITCATAFKNRAFEKETTACLAKWQVNFEKVIALLTPFRFTHSLLTHDQSVLVDIGTRVVAHFLRLVILDSQDNHSKDFGQ